MHLTQTEKASAVTILYQDESVTEWAKLETHFRFCHIVQWVCMEEGRKLHWNKRVCLMDFSQLGKSKY